MQRVLVTTGRGFTDIDGFACVIAYTHLLRQEKHDVIAYLPSPINHSVPNYVLQWNLDYSTDYLIRPDDRFVVTDVSDPTQLPEGVRDSSIIELYDHHFGFEKHWSDRIHEKSKIEQIGACGTLIVEEYQKRANTRISSQVANLLALAIVSNTLNFNAGVTHERDRVAFQYLMPFLTLEKEWVQNYFSSNDTHVYANPEDSMQGDTKVVQSPFIQGELAIAQLELWEGESFIEKNMAVIKRMIQTSVAPHWVLTVVSIRDGHNYLYTTSQVVKDVLKKKIGATFEGDRGTTKTLLLRKEILRELKA